MVTRNGSEDQPKKLNIFSEKTLLPLGFVIMLAGGGYWLGQIVTKIEQDRIERRNAEERIVQQMAEIKSAIHAFVTKEQFVNWTTLLKAKLPQDLQGSVPDFK